MSSNFVIKLRVMIATKNTTIDHISYNKPTSIIDLINQKIEKEQHNSIGISVILIIVNTMIASATAALAIHGEVSMFILMFACVTAMGTNAAVFSQRAFKYVAWAGIISIIGNSILAIYQTIALFI